MTNFIRLGGAAIVPFGGQFIREAFSEPYLFYLSVILIFPIVIFAWVISEEIEDVEYT